MPITKEILNDDVEDEDKMRIIAVGLPEDTLRNFNAATLKKFNLV